MKFKFTLFMLAPLFFLSCSQEAVIEEDQPTANLFNAVNTGTQNTVNLYDDVLFAGQTIDVGVARVDLEDGIVFVSYETEGDWIIEETHLFVGQLADVPTNGGGNPKIGQFPFKDTHTGNTTLVSYDTGFTLVNGECLYVAAHAVVTNTVTGQSETAWFNGDPFGGNSWAMISHVCH